MFRDCVMVSELQQRTTKTVFMPELFDSSLDNIISLLAKQRFAKRIAEYEAQIEERIKLGCGTPVIEGDNAYFFYDNPNGETVSVTGDWNSWRPGVDLLEPINPKSSIYFLKKKFAIDARLAYRFLIHGKDSINDPRNPNSLQEVFGNNTFVKMPAYQVPTYLQPPTRAVPHGQIKTLQIKSATAGDAFAREVTIYIPHGMRVKGRVPFLYVHDGAEAVSIGRFIDLLDNLYHHEPHLPKMIVVFVPPVDRLEEYMMNPSFARWNARVLVPHVEKFLKVTSTASLRGIQGASLGGLLGAYIGLNHPTVFGNIAAQSASFWFDDQAIVKAYTSKRKLPLRFFMQTGTINDALEGTRAMLEALQKKGYDITYRETNESHNWANWNAKYAEIVRWMVKIT